MPPRKRVRKQLSSQEDDEIKARRHGTPLPPCDGPKLLPFSRRDAPIQFMRLLSDPDRDQESHVFEVRIGGEVYALKVFRFFDDSALDDNIYGSEREAAPDDALSHLDYYYAPFYNECRAFGSLIKAKQNGEIAVQCHGYLSLPARWEAKLNAQFGELDWDRLDDDSAQPVAKRNNLMAIVKDLIHDDVPWTQKVLRRCLKDLKKIREHGVYPMDIRADNYVGGLLVDLSEAYTLPHFIFDIKPPHWARIEKEQDLAMFDSMVDDLRINTNFRATLNYKYRYKLRHSTRTSKFDYYEGPTKNKRKKTRRR
ncbi:MAG: hypothetical protein Q9174_004193 [Haloplaca sp. 1 TL-2023]